MSDIYELKAAVLACRECTELPVFATVTVDDSGRLLTGADIPAVVAVLEGLGVSALGLNCSLEPERIAPFAKEMLKYASVPVIITPNAGLPGCLREKRCRKAPRITPKAWRR
jgi:5-methyltetrahydrofolate--homocysteine methyltransferase